MQATFCFSLSVVCFLIDFASSETSTDSQLDDNVNTATVSKHLLLDDMDGSLGRNALFSHRSGASMQSQGKPEAEVRIHSDIQQPPKFVTRLTKPYITGFDPHFNQGFFKPVGKRYKPVTLLGFRKNGLSPKKKVALNAIKDSSDVAEMQSPYNDISNFWVDEPGQS